MFKRIIAAAALGGVLLASGCETDGTYAGGGYYGGYYSGYYDDFYGPVSYGYWGPDNYFYYSTTLEGPYVRDEARHFRASAGSIRTSSARVVTRTTTTRTVFEIGQAETGKVSAIPMMAPLS